MTKETREKLDQTCSPSREEEGGRPGARETTEAVQEIAPRSTELTNLG